jgi:hypothetical protein
MFSAVFVSVFGIGYAAPSHSTTVSDEIKNLTLKDPRLYFGLKKYAAVGAK